MTKPIEGADYVVRQVDFGDATIPGAVRPNDDDTYSIYINSRTSQETQRKTLDHEVAHIAGDDFHNNKPIREIEHKPEAKKPHSRSRGTIDALERVRVQSLIRQAWGDDHIHIFDAEDASLEDLEEALAWLKILHDGEHSLDWS